MLVRVRAQAERTRADAWAVACAFGERVHSAGLLARCEASHQARGALTLQLRIPGPDEDGDRRISFADAGSLAGTPLGRCVLDGLRSHAAAREVPVTQNGLVSTRTLEFPGARTLWTGRRDPCAR